MRIEDNQGNTNPGHEGHDPGRPEKNVHPSPKFDSEHPGYETQDVNATGIAVFLAGLSASLIVFFFLCFFLGKLINTGLAESDGKTDKWHQNASLIGNEARGQKRQDLTSDAEMEQRELAQIAQNFPNPRVPVDDDNQETADLHSREDLMLDHYSTGPDLGGGKIRIPIDRAMQLIVQQGLGAGTAPTATASTTTPMFGDAKPVVTAPLTDGFARTSYELTTMETRKQRMEFEHAGKETKE